MRGARVLGIGIVLGRSATLGVFDFVECGASLKIGIARHRKSMYYIELRSKRKSEKVRKTHTECQKSASITQAFKTL
jgi:hypothetical protein